MKSHVLPQIWRALPVVVASVLLGGCNKEPPKKPVDEPKKTTPVPSDMVLNDFVPSGGGGGIVGVKTDGGMLEGGMASAEQPAAAGATEPAAPDDAMKLHVTEAGAEPRAARRYAFVANHGDKRQITVRQSASQAGGPAQENTFLLTADFTPKRVLPAATKFELKVLKIEMPDVPAAQRAQAAAQFAPLTGLTGAFDITARGEIGEVDFKADERMQGPAAEMVVQSLQQSLELLVPPFPAEPVGVGARWDRKVERKERGMENSAKHSFTLKELTAEGGVVTADVEIAVPKHPFVQRGVPPGATEEVKGKGSYTYAFKFDHICTKVEGDMAITRTIELVDPKGGKQSVATVIKLKNRLEQPGGAAAVPAPKP